MKLFVKINKRAGRRKFERKVSMADRMTRWFWLTVLLTIIPILAALLFSFINNITLNAYDFNSELLFFIIALSLISLCDMAELIDKKVLPKFISITLIVFLGLFLASSAMMYGSIIADTTEIAEYYPQRRIFTISVIIVLISFVLGTIIQGILGKYEDKIKKSMRIN